MDLSMILIQFSVGNWPHHKNHYHNRQTDRQLDQIGQVWNKYRGKRTAHSWLEVAQAGQGKEPKKQGLDMENLHWMENIGLQNTQNSMQQNAMHCMLFKHDKF